MSNTPGELSSIIDDLWIEIIISDEHRLLLQTVSVWGNSPGFVKIASTRRSLISNSKRILVSAADVAEVDVVNKKRHTSR
jgi:hypothetical protein